MPIETQKGIREGHNVISTANLFKRPNVLKLLSLISLCSFVSQFKDINWRQKGYINSYKTDNDGYWGNGHTNLKWQMAKRVHIKPEK